MSENTRRVGPVSYAFECVFREARRTTQHHRPCASASRPLRERRRAPLRSEERRAKPTFRSRDCE